MRRIHWHWNGRDLRGFKNLACLIIMKKRILDMKTLILTEKPSVAKDFAGALKVRGNRDGYMENEDYIITWAVGHLVELLEPDDYDEKWKKWRMDTLPVIPDQFRYKPIPKTEKQLGIIRKLLTRKEIENIVIATDAGREGEVIARTILLFSEFKNADKLKRFWTSQALTPEVVREGMAELSSASEYDRLWRAGQCRQIADWLVGMNGSRAATIRMNDLFTVGRVQTAVLALLSDRRRERENFKPEPYWMLRACFLNDAGTWWGIWFKHDETRFKTEEAASEVRAKILEQTGKVLSVKKQKKKQPPPPLYSLTELQQDANKKFGFSAEQTLNTAQGLYETRKCLSYPRTDSKVLGTKNVDMVRNLFKKLSMAYAVYFADAEEKLVSKSNKRVFNDAKLTDHHALIPLAPIPKNANQDETKIYGLVLKRFAAAFHPDCEYEQTEIITQVEKEKFRTKGKLILKPGWRVVYEIGEQKQKKEEQDTEEVSSENLPPLAKGDPAEVREAKIEKKKTTPPPEYTEALLLKDMTNPGRYVSEDEFKKLYRGDVGLGTQATRAQIIETILSRGYVLRKKKHIIATDKGCRLIEVLRQFEIAGVLTSPEETARWEMQLNQIARGECSDEDFINNIRAFIEQTISEFKAKPLSLFSLPPSHSGTCPNCGGKIIKGKRDYGCSNWRKEDGACRFVIRSNISGRMITPHMISKLLSEKEVGPLSDFISEDGNPFSAILKLIKVEDKWEISTEPVEANEAKSETSSKSDVFGECPVCGGNVIEGPKGYGCANWKHGGGCRFIIWKTVAKREISAKTAKQLLENGMSDLLFGFTSRKGNAFSAKLKLENDDSGVPRTVFDFSDVPKMGSET